MNSRPLSAVSSDSDSPFILTPNMLLAQKTDSMHGFPVRQIPKTCCVSSGKEHNILLLYSGISGKKKYLHTLQNRRKWHQTERNVQVNDVILLKNKDVHRNDWPFGIVTKVFLGEDDLVRKVELKVSRNGRVNSYIRPVHEIVVLLEQ